MAEPVYRFVLSVLLAGKVVRESLNSVHAWFFNCPLGDLAHGAERHATFARYLSLRDGLGS